MRADLQYVGRADDMDGLVRATAARLSRSSFVRRANGKGGGGFARAAAKVAAGLGMLALGHAAGVLLQGAVQNKRLTLGTRPGWGGGASIDEEAAEAQKLQLNPTAVLLGAAAYWCVMAGAALLVLVVMGVHVAGVIAATATAGVLVGFAMQGILSDVTAGIVIALTGVFYIGEVIEVDGVRGVVVSFNVINTTMLDFYTRTRTTLPNRLLQSSMVHNLSRQPRRKVAVDALVSNTNADFRAIAEVMRAAVLDPASELPPAGGALAQPPTVGVFDMGNVGTLMRVSFVIDANDLQAGKLVMMRLRVRQALAEAGVKLVDPF
jgi:small-conductance mechanosensitive channel